MRLLESPLIIQSDGSIERNDLSLSIVTNDLELDAVHLSGNFEAGEAISEAIAIFCGEEFTKPPTDSFFSGIAEQVEPGLIYFLEEAVAI
jgi:hypothetical protein